MSEVTRILNAVQQGDPKAAEDLIPLVYEELRKLAAHKMANEAPGQTLQPTALVHEAWLRLVGKDEPARFQNRAHFFGAAAEAMRRILIERARRRKVLEKGGFVTPEECTVSKLIVTAPADELLAVHEALESLTAEDAVAADLVKLRYFVGMSMPEAAEALGMPLAAPSGSGRLPAPGCGTRSAEVRNRHNDERIGRGSQRLLFFGSAEFIPPNRWQQTVAAE